MKEENIPGFIKKYMDSLEDNGYSDFVILSREYQRSVDHYNSVQYPEQSASMRDLNESDRTNKVVDYDAGRKSIDQKFQKHALELAKKHGFKEYDEELTKDQDKFQKLSDSYKQDKEAEQLDIPDTPLDIPPDSPANDPVDKETAKRQFINNLKKQKDKEKGIERE